VVGAGAVLQTTTGAARADGNEGPTLFSSDNSQVNYAVQAVGTNGAYGITAYRDIGTGVYSESSSGTAIEAFAFNVLSNAVSGRNDSGTGLYGRSDSGMAIHGFSFGSGIGIVAQNDSGTALRVSGHMQMFGNAVGKATLSAGQTAVTVSTSAATKSSNVLLTPLANPKANLWVTRAAGNFTIHASAAPSSNLAIAYLIIN
jgi:hypothetical protein